MVEEVNLFNCDKEPIHIPGKIQSHGFILVCDPDELKITQASTNLTNYTNIEVKDILNQKIDKLISHSDLNKIQEILNKKEYESTNITQVEIKNKSLNLIISLSDSLVIFEFEPTLENSNIYSDFYHSFNTDLNKIQSSKNLEHLFKTTTEEIRKITKYDRVMIYRFNKDWHGEVVAESKIDCLEPLLGLHYPHTDIPSQARDLYLTNWIRLITDVNDNQPMIIPTINPLTNKPLDLSLTVLRATSSIHIEYLKNMGIRATLTISIIFEGKLWGLFACHNYSPKFVDYYARKNCELIGKVFSSHLSYKEKDEDIEYSKKINYNTTQIIDKMTKDWSIYQGLFEGNLNLLDMNDSTGAIYYNNGEIHSIGKIPSENQIKNLVNFLDKKKDNVFYTDELSEIYNPALEFKDKGSGILAINISDNSYIIWFKPEVVQSVNWAGKPDEKHIVHENDLVRLSPRKSFEKWTQEVKNKSTEWKKSEISVAESLRENIINVVLKKSQEIKKLNDELELQKLALISKNDELLNFAYIASHDLKEPLRMITSYNQLVLKRYRDKLDDDAEDFLNYSIDGAKRMRELIESLLEYAKIGYDEKNFSLIDTNYILDSCIDNLQLLIKERNVDFTKSEMPIVYGDRSLLSILFQNIISNAIKYGNKDNPKINIKYYDDGDYHKFSIEDNGIGIENKDFHNIFLMFKKLHSKMEFEGSGIGLATSKKIVEYHGGNIWLESTINKGTTFYFTLLKI